MSRDGRKRFLPPPPPSSPISVSLRDNATSPSFFPLPSLFLFIYKFVTLTHSLVGRKMFVEEFLTARTSSSQQQIYRISIFTISIYVANMLYNNSLVSFCRFFIISPRQFLLLAIVLHFTCWVKISKTGNSLGDRWQGLWRIGGGQVETMETRELSYHRFHRAFMIRDTNNRAHE